MVKLGYQHHPEGDYIVARNESGGGIVALEVLGAVGPAESRERPERRGEPGVKNVLLLSYLAATLGTGANIGLGYLHMTALITVEGGNSVSPPELTGYAPIEDVVHPVEVILGESLGNELYRAVLYRLYCGCGEGLHFNEPLVRGERLNGSSAAIARTYVMSVGLGLYEISLAFKICNKRTAAGISVHTLVLTCVCVHSSVVVHNLDLLEVVSLTYEEVVGIVSGGDLYATRTKADFNVVVGNTATFS